MLLNLFRSLVVPATLLGVCLTLATDGRAEDDCRYRAYGSPDLFYNEWVNPNCGGMGAALYLSPRPVPPIAGHTFITYQPLMPHEMLYQHHRTYSRYYNDGRGLTRTSVRWR